MSEDSNPPESWFSKDSPDTEEEDDELPPPVLEGSLRWSVVLGALGGAIGGGAMVLLAGELARRLRSDVDVVRTIGSAARFLGSNAFAVGLGTSIAIGAVLGLFFGPLMRYTLRFVARLLAGMLLAPVLWTLVHAFVFKSFTPALGALPFGPMVVGAVAYGLCIAILRPPTNLRIITPV